MHRLSTSFVLGYHGCEHNVAEKLIDGADFTASKNAYDWLGHGVYFWEANPRRGLEFAEDLKTLRRASAPKVSSPAVVGAIIELGLCLDLTTTSGISQVRTAYEKLRKIADAAKQPLPQNRSDQRLRYLDCAVIQFLHSVKEREGEQPIDTVKGVFVEGEPIYPTSGIHAKTHIQVCVRNLECIKGVFRVPDRLLSS